MHAHPERNWMVDELAREVGLSRSALHERFVQYLGNPPMQYLAHWHIQLSARLLRESNRTVATIALEVGYDSEAAFSRAFRRMVGMPPATWPKAQTGALKQNRSDSNSRKPRIASSSATFRRSK